MKNKLNIGEMYKWTFLDSHFEPESGYEVVYLGMEKEGYDSFLSKEAVDIVLLPISEDNLVKVHLRNGTYVLNGNKIISSGFSNPILEPMFRPDKGKFTELKEIAKRMGFNLPEPNFMEEEREYSKLIKILE